MSVFSTKAEKVFILAFFFIALGVPLFFNENTFYVNKISTMLILSIFVMFVEAFRFLSNRLMLAKSTDVSVACAQI